ncbi:hypothetical protein IC235_05580 [Hymenobacter sp. BT664]|uniref:Uncharacterized protein n=1 Tax=Hymenobacter montanus TaxID=2771359 RepID=A0A927BC28_9BACT|nr:hypothetical protein [Hymenobacter montanus]MBD2767358.1 hypothetical protein [Hymenobacter montanus]
MADLTSPWLHSLRLWCLTNFVGTSLVGLYCVTAPLFGSSAIENLVIALIIGGIAALFSSPVIALVVFVFNKILSVPSRQYCWLLVFFAITGLWLLTLLLAVLFLVRGILHDALIFSSPYYLAALLAVGVVYRPWLFTKNE